MKNLVFISIVLCALIVGGVSWKDTAAKAKKQRAVAEFDQPTSVYGVVLKGKYLFVHDDAAMARHEACTFVYKGESEIASKLVVSFHCTPVERAKADHFIWRSGMNPSGVVELREFQFTGETEAHGVPIVKETASIPLAN